MICRICYLPAGGCHIPVPGVLYYSGTGIIIGTRTVQFYTCTRSELGCLSWWLPIKLPCTHYPTPQAHNHVELKQNISISMADVGGSRSSCAVAADDLGSGQQGGSSADPGVALFLPHMYVLPCVSCTGIKLALAHTFTFARVHPACSSSCFTHVCQGGI